MLTTVALAVGLAGSTHHISLSEPVVVAGTELKPGEYKVELEGDRVTITNAKQKVETTAKTGTASEKFDRSSVRFTNVDGKNRVEEIRLGGTHTKLLFPVENGSGPSN